MDVEIERCLDAGEPDEQGAYDYRYEYDVYTFTDGAETIHARSYTDEPDCASFAVSSGELGQSPLFWQAVAHLTRLGKTQIQCLESDGYRDLAERKPPKSFLDKVLRFFQLT